MAEGRGCGQRLVGVGLGLFLGALAGMLVGCLLGAGMAMAFGIL